jgi:hypothetical protein
VRTSVASWKVTTIGEAYTVIVWGVGLSHEILEIAGAFVWSFFDYLDHAFFAPFLETNARNHPLIGARVACTRARCACRSLLVFKLPHKA